MKYEKTNTAQAVLQWTVPHLSIMFIYYSAWSISIQWIRVMIAMRQSALVNTKGSLLPVCDKSIHTKKESTERGGD